MKKHIVAIVLVASLAMAGAASANWGRGGRGGGGDCPLMQGQMMQQLDPESRAKVTKFFKDNQALHKQIAMKQAEKRAIMQSEKPDPQTAAKIAGELFDLRTAMFEKAEAAGVSQYIGPMGMGGPMGGGKGFRGQGRGAVGAPGMGANAPQQ